MTLIDSSDGLSQIHSCIAPHVPKIHYDGSEQYQMSVSLTVDRGIP